MIDIKCADDEPTKACVDAANQLLDKIATMPRPGTEGTATQPAQPGTPHTPPQ
jgi:hypothetical protein